jgi:hypothetical protein
VVIDAGHGGKDPGAMGNGLREKDLKVFFFTDNSFAELEKLMTVRTGGGGVQSGIEASQKKLAENFNDWWSNVRAGNFLMRNLAARMLADLTDPSSRGFFLADFKGDRSGDLLFNLSWNRDLLLLPDISNDEEVMLLHYNLANYYEWWAGFHLTEEYARTPHPEHRTLGAHCRQNRIHAEIVKDNRLNAIAEMEFEVPGGSARVIPFNLAGVLRIAAVQDGEGKNLSFIQEDRRLDNDPWLIMPEPAAAGSAWGAAEELLLNAGRRRFAQPGRRSRSRLDRGSASRSCQGA